MAEQTADIQLAISPLDACASASFNLTVTSTEIGPFTLWALETNRLPSGWEAGWATQSDARRYPFISITTDENRASSQQVYTWTPQPALTAGQQLTFAVFGGNGVGLLGGSVRDEWLRTVPPCTPVATSSSAFLASAPGASAIVTALMPPILPPLSEPALSPSALPPQAPQVQQEDTARRSGIVAGSVVGSMILLAFLMVLVVTHRKTRRDSMAERDSIEEKRIAKMDEEEAEKRKSSWVPHSQAFARAAELYDDMRSPWTPHTPPTALMFTKEDEEKSEGSIEKDADAFGNDEASEVVSIASVDEKEDEKLAGFIPRYDSDNASGTTTTVSHPSAHTSFMEPMTPPSSKPWLETAKSTDDARPQMPSPPPNSTITHRPTPSPAIASEDQDAEVMDMHVVKLPSRIAARGDDLPPRPGSAASWRERWGRLTDAMPTWPYAPPKLSLSRSTSRASSSAV